MRSTRPYTSTAPPQTSSGGCTASRRPINSCICDLPDEQVDDGPWIDGPLIDNVAHRAAVLGIAPTRVGEVLPFLIETATAMGLTVFNSPPIERVNDPHWMVAYLVRMIR